MPKTLSVRKPARVAAVLSILTNQAHVDALHVISRAGRNGAKVRDLQEALKCSRAHANTIVGALEAANFIRGNPPPDERRAGGDVTVYRVNRRKVESALLALRRHLLAIEALSDRDVTVGDVQREGTTNDASN